MRQYSPPTKMRNSEEKNLTEIRPLEMQKKLPFESRDLKIKEPSIYGASVYNGEQGNDELTESEKKVVEVFQKRRNFTLKA